MHGSLDPYEDDPDFVEFLKALVGRKVLAGDALEVAKLAIKSGVTSLSKSRREVLKGDIIQAHAIAYCPLGKEPHTWGTMAEAVESGTGACGFCEDTAESAKEVEAA